MAAGGPDAGRASDAAPAPVLRDWLAGAPASRAAAFLREPEHDDDAREQGDMDLLVFDDDIDELLVQRVVGADGASLDLLRLPGALLADRPRLAGMGLITHRLLTARPVFDRDGAGSAVLQQVRDLASTPAARQARIASFLEMGALAVREVGVTGDWPALARFWLHMAQAAALAAACDSRGHWCPSVYTRPHRAALAAEAWLGRPVVASLDDSLGLHVDPAAVADALRVLHALVRQACPEPRWPDAMPQATRWEYRYWSSPAELQERLDAAQAMAAQGRRAQAVFYLRYTAYSTLRLAMLHQRALEGWPRPIPFLRPETEVRPDLDAHLPQAVPLADAVFGGASADDLAHALQVTQALHAAVVDDLSQRGDAPASPRAWRPHGAAGGIAS